MWNEWWSVRYTMTVVSLVAFELCAPVQSSHERPARSGYATAHQPVVRGCLVTTSPVVCLPLLKRWHGSSRPDGGNACRLR